MQNFSTLSWKQKIMWPFEVLVVILLLRKAWKWPKSEFLYFLSWNSSNSPHNPFLVAKIKVFEIKFNFWDWWFFDFINGLLKLFKANYEKSVSKKFVNFPNLSFLRVKFNSCSNRVKKHTQMHIEWTLNVFIFQWSNSKFSVALFFIAQFLAQPGKLSLFKVCLLISLPSAAHSSTFHSDSNQSNPTQTVKCFLQNDCFSKGKLFQMIYESFGNIIQW